MCTCMDKYIEAYVIRSIKSSKLVNVALHWKHSIDFDGLSMVMWISVHTVRKVTLIDSVSTSNAATFAFEIVRLLDVHDGG